MTLKNGVSAWAFSSSQYFQSAVKNVEAHLSKSGGKLPTCAATPFSSGYWPEIDVSEELSPTYAAYYQSLIGILCWIVKLGRMDMTCEVSMMASMMALPCKGHLQELYHMFAYLKHHHNAELVLDPTVRDFDVELLFPRKDWKHAPFVDAREEIPSNTPEARGLGFIIFANVDSDHAGDEITRCSRTGFIVF